MKGEPRETVRTFKVLATAFLAIVAAAMLTLIVAAFATDWGLGMFVLVALGIFASAAVMELGLYERFPVVGMLAAAYIVLLVVVSLGWSYATDPDFRQGLHVVGASVLVVSFFVWVVARCILIVIGE